jgi:hypothetical protein
MMTTERGFGRYINLAPEDIPTKEQLLAALERLEKDAAILRSYKTEGKEQDAKQFDVVASFLRMVAEMKK